MYALGIKPLPRERKDRSGIVLGDDSISELRYISLARSLGLDGCVAMQEYSSIYSSRSRDSGQCTSDALYISSIEKVDQTDAR